MKILERYSAAVNSDNLSVDERTTWADSDVLGAAGLAARHEPLGVALTRMFADGKPELAVSILSEMAYGRSHHLRIKITKLQTADLAKAVLGWYRHGTCQPCGGTGYQVIPNTPVQGEECPHCKASGRLNFDRQFDRGLCECCGGAGLDVGREVTYFCASCEATGAKFLPTERAEQQLLLARWMAVQIDRAQATAGVVAMALLAPRLEL